MGCNQKSQAAHDAKTMGEPIEFSAWCFENGRRYIGAASYEEFKKNADDYTAYRTEFLALKGGE
jgi:hypothetical protein